MLTRPQEPELKQSWERICQRLKAELGEDLYASWFARMDAEEWNGGRLAVSVPTRFLKNWIETHYMQKLIKLSETELGPIDAVLVRVRTRGLPQRLQLISNKDLDERPNAASDAAAQRAPDPGADKGSPLDPGQTFESFITGHSNALAHAAALRVAEQLPGAGLSFNPLFIHAAAGLGKTHLLNAVAWRIRQRHPGRRVLYSTAERFMYHFIQALRQRDTITFKDFFLSIDVLIVDDLQFLQGKSMQQEFCHTFNGMVDARRQVIVAADVPPSQLEAIDQRMRSRLTGGLVVDIELPELEMRRAILLSRLERLKHRDPAFAVEPEVIEFMANKITGGGRELEGGLNRIAAWQQFNKGPITLDLAAMVLKDMSQNPDQCRVRIDDILKVVGRHYNVPRADLLSPRRARSVVVPRQIGMYLAKKLTPRSLPEIGRRFGGRDHSTVLHAVRKIEELMKSDDRLQREVALLIRLIEQG